MDAGRTTAGKAKMLLVPFGAAGLLVVLSLLHPVNAHPTAAAAQITPTAFVYMPYIAKAGPPPIPGVDLIVWDIVIDPAEPVVGESFVITITVKNRGSDDASERAHVRLNVVEVEWLEVERDRPPLTAGATDDVSFRLNVPTLGPGSYTARAEVDPYRAVPETYEDNNVMKQRFVMVSSSR